VKVKVYPRFDLGSCAVVRTEGARRTRLPGIFLGTVTGEEDSLVLVEERSAAPGEGGSVPVKARPAVLGEARPAVREGRSVPGEARPAVREGGWSLVSALE